MSDAACGGQLISQDYRIVPGIGCAVRRDERGVVTETRVVGTSRNATLFFAPYWAVIRLPSGLIRRSMLAAIERRATAPVPSPVPA